MTLSNEKAYNQQCVGSRPNRHRRWQVKSRGDAGLMVFSDNCLLQYSDYVLCFSVLGRLPRLSLGGSLRRVHSKSSKLLFLWLQKVEITVVFQLAILG